MMVKFRLNRLFLIVFVVCIFFILMIWGVLEAMTTFVIGEVTDYGDRVIEIVVTDCSNNLLSEIFYDFKPNGSISEGDKLVVPVSEGAWFFSDKDISLGDEVKIEFLLQEIPTYGSHSVLNHAGVISKTGR